MKRTAFLLSAAVSFIFLTSTNSACLYTMETVDGNGNVVRQDRNVSPFRAIQVGSSFEVSLVQGDKESVVVEADENLMEYIVTEVRGHTLIAGTEKNLRNYDRLRLIVTFRELDQIDARGAVKIYGDDTLTFEDLSLEASGATEVILDLEAYSLSLGSSGASHLRLAGRCRTASLESSGASSLRADDLETEEFMLNISGAGEASVFVTKTLDVSVSGASHVKYKGNPQMIRQKTSGASSISN